MPALAPTGAEVPRVSRTVLVPGREHLEGVRVAALGPLDESGLHTYLRADPTP